ncbi:MAG TPA: S53 family peptidase, partial [Candidatus Binataceae bacterium]|nr:S53 family peptidase [Candidatus Binataceae bacterium]
RVIGASAQLDATFRTAMASAGDGLYANTAAPQIPARFDGVISMIVGLDNLRASFSHAIKAPPHVNVHSESGSGNAQPNTVNGIYQAFGAVDLQTFYDELPVLNAGYTGTGDCIGIIGDSDYRPEAVTLFTSTFAIPSAAVTTVLSSNTNATNTYTNPGRNSDEVETLIDIEWAHSAAPGAPIFYYLGDDNSSGPLYGVGDALTKAITDNACSMISMSFGYCASSDGELAQTAAAFAPMLQQAAAQGQSVFIASGDEGAAGIVYSPDWNRCVVANTPTPSVPATDPNVTAVGGASFEPTFDANGLASGTVNDTAINVWDGYFGGSGGGMSTFSAKPSYQIGTTPNDGARDLPDISAISDPFAPGVFLGSDGNPSPFIDCCWGGTSVAAPVTAGFFKLIEQKSRGRLGRINDRIYQIASAANSAANGLRDITVGNNSYQGVTGYDATVGFDLATGWGQVDVSQLVTSYMSTFFNGEALLGGGWGFLSFTNGTPFGYYNYNFYPWLFHGDLGFEYFVDGRSSSGGIYLYDQSLGQWFYTDPASFPFLYNFAAGAWYYYFPDSNNPGHYLTNPRIFENVTSKQMIFS